MDAFEQDLDKSWETWTYMNKRIFKIHFVNTIDKHALIKKYLGSTIVSWQRHGETQ